MLGVRANRLIGNVDHAPTFSRERMIAPEIALTASGGEMLPTVALKRNAERGQHEVNGEPTDLMLEQVWDAQLNEHRLGHTFDVGSISAPSLPAKRSRLKSLSHSEECSAAVGAAALTLCGSVSFRDVLDATVGAGDRCAAGRKRARTGAVPARRLLAWDDSEWRGAVWTDDLKHGTSSAFADQRAIGVAPCFALANGEGKAAMRTDLRDAVLPTGVRAESTSDTCATLVADAAPFAGVPGIRGYAVLRAFGTAHDATSRRSSRRDVGQGRRETSGSVQVANPHLALSIVPRGWCSW